MRRTIVLGAIPLLAALACRHRVATAPTAENPCWSYVASSPLTPDRVARRYMDAFHAVGLDDPMWFTHADTAWALTHAPTLADSARGARYAARVVAYRKGDSTHFRQYVTRLAGTQATSGDSASTPGVAAVCARITRAAAMDVTAPTAPTGDETLGVWRLGTEPR